MAVDFGWGTPVYGGPATIILATFHLEGRNEAGEVGVNVPTRMPVLALERLKVEVTKGLTVTGRTVTEPADKSKSALVPGHALAKL